MKVTVDFAREFRRIWEVVRRPKQFFKAIEKEKKLQNAISFYLVLLLISVGLSLIDLALVRPVAETYLPGFVVPFPLEISWLAVPSILLSTFLLFLLSFLYVGLLTLWIRLFGGKGGYTRTYQIYVYSRTPAVLVGWMPVLGMFGAVYSLGLLVYATHKLHKISKRRTLILYGVLAVVLLALGVVTFSS